MLESLPSIDFTRHVGRGALNPYGFSICDFVLPRFCKTFTYDFDSLQPNIFPVSNANFAMLSCSVAATPMIRRYPTLGVRGNEWRERPNGYSRAETLFLRPDGRFGRRDRVGGRAAQ